MRGSHLNLLGLFPSFEKIGGVETSGRIAWEPFAAEPNKHLLFSYGDAGFGAAGDGNGHVVHAASKSQAVLNALRRQWPARIVLVWHVGLLKLLPFLRLHNAKVAVFLHGIEAWREQDAITRRLLRHVDLFLSNTEHTWRRFVAFNPDFANAPHQTVHLGIGQPCASPIEAPEHPAMLMIGRMLVGERYKGHNEVLAVWPEVVARHPRAQLWIVGPGPLRQELERRAKAQGLERSVRIYGQVSEEVKQDMLRRCQCLALPSRGEGFGLVYLEAMRMGRPCLISTLDGGREVVNPPEAGLAADPENLSELTDAACRLLNAGAEWDAWSDRARRRYEGTFTAEHFQTRLLAALTELAQ
jgi:phosphatidyl-myo-inositol dimannoside synthase